MKVAALTIAFALAPLVAQSPAPPQEWPIRTFPLNYATSMSEQNEILTAIRNMVKPDVKIFLVPSQNQIVVSASPEQDEGIARLVQALDQRKPLYRLTYIFIETDGGKRISQQQYTMMLAPGQLMTLKEGDRIPVMTGSVGTEPVTRHTNYLDVGFNFQSTITPYGPEGVRLQSRVERSAIAQEKTSILAEDPIIRQSTLEGVTNLALRKAQHLGNFDVVGSTRQLQMDALIELVK